MFYLILSILSTTVIYLLFQVFQRYKVDLFPALLINYFTCAVVALFFGDVPYGKYLSEINNNLLLFSILLGASFISVFYLMSSATQLLGVAGGTIVSRMSMVIPAGFSIIYFHEPFTFLKIFGILLAISAIYFSVGKPAGANQNIQNADKSRRNLLIPILAFFGVGMVDTLLKISQITFFGNKADSNFVGLAYFWSFMAGFLFVILFKREYFKLIFQRKNLLWGFILGIPNYFSIYLFYKALTTPHLHGSTIFPVNSVGIVAFSSVAAVIFLHENLNRAKITGLLMAIVAIVLLSW